MNYKIWRHGQGCLGMRDNQSFHLNAHEMGRLTNHVALLSQASSHSYFHRQLHREVTTVWVSGALAQSTQDRPHLPTLPGVALKYPQTPSSSSPFNIRLNPLLVTVLFYFFFPAQRLADITTPHRSERTPFQNIGLTSNSYPLFPLSHRSGSAFFFSTASRAPDYLSVITTHPSRECLPLSKPSQRGLTTPARGQSRGLS